VTLNPNPKLNSGMAGAVFAPTPTATLAKVPIRPWPIYSLKLSHCGTSVLCCLSYRFYSASTLLDIPTHCSVRLSGAFCLAPTRFAAEYCLTHAITHHPPQTDPPCSAVSLRQLTYLFISLLLTIYRVGQKSGPFLKVHKFCV